MHPHERLRALLAATRCTACGASLDARGIRVLAERDDLAFAELACVACGSTTLAIVTDDPSGSPEVDVGSPGAADRRRSTLDGAPPIEEADVTAMRDLLREHRGDLRSLLREWADGGIRDDRPGTAS